MASRRMLPTRFFKDPDVMNLQSKDYMVVLIGLTLMADDEGREVAHAPLLGRELNYPEDLIEKALQDLATNELIQLYQIGRHRYYTLTRWRQWQTIPPSRMIPSKHPAPPPIQEAQTDACIMQTNAYEVQADAYELSPQSNISEYKIGEEGEEHNTPSNIVTFPTSPHSNTSTTQMEKQETDAEKIQQLAGILKLPVSDALQRIIEDFQDLPLMGEADAAREWIDDRQKNKQQTPMSVKFFRRWLRREHEEALVRQKQREQQPTGTAGAHTPSPAPARQSLMNLQAQYQASRSLVLKEKTEHE